MTFGKMTKGQNNRIKKYESRNDLKPKSPVRNYICTKSANVEMTQTE